jgi:hypothetical protein
MRLDHTHQAFQVVKLTMSTVPVCLASELQRSLTSTRAGQNIWVYELKLRSEGAPMQGSLRLASRPRSAGEFTPALLPQSTDGISL